MNSSNVLANRTRRLMDSVKPDVLFVQASESWWNKAKLLSYVKSQQEMSKADSTLNTPIYMQGTIGFKIRFALFNAISKLLYGLPMEYNPFLPGLEVKYALEEAVKNNTKIVFLGEELNLDTRNMLVHEKRNTVFSLIRNYFRLPQSYKTELLEMRMVLKERGMNNFVESSMDARQMNWFIKSMEGIAPTIKKILVDKKDEEIFKTIAHNIKENKKMVLLVNQHHMEGVEHHWCNSFGTVPTYNVYNPLDKEINPIGDMPLRKMLYEKMYHVIQRDIKSSRMRSPPASFTNDINIYHREFNHQYEHRNM